MHRMNMLTVSTLTHQCSNEHCNMVADTHSPPPPLSRIYRVYSDNSQRVNVLIIIRSRIYHAFLFQRHSLAHFSVWCLLYFPFIIYSLRFFRSRIVSELGLKPREMSAASKLIYKWFAGPLREVRYALEHDLGVALDWAAGMLLAYNYPYEHALSCASTHNPLLSSPH